MDLATRDGVEDLYATQRRQLEELYRQQISAVRTLARLLGYPCPIASRQERRAMPVQPIDDCDTIPL